MPRTTYGPEIQKRVKRLLEALLGFVDGEFEDGNFKIEYDWKEEDSANPKLTVQTTLVTLELLTQKDKYSGKLTKAQIREALNLLKDFLKILEDNRLQTKGVEEWHFTLKLWSRNRERNLKRFDEAWESSRPEKSKLNNPSPNLSPTGREALNFPHSLVGKGVRGLGHTSIFQAPPLPTYFVERPEYSDDLKTRLLNGSSSDSRTLVITAIHGLGSVGKSTLAAALAHDEEVKSRFCDGILWATLGQEPNVLSLLSGWVQALGDYSFKPTSVAATSNHLRTLLYNKDVLLVVDDAWNTKDAQAFNVGGVRCQVLVTTREGSIAHALGAKLYNLDVMKPAQAMELLKNRLGRDIIGVERQSAENLAEAVGYLPLALELAAVQVASGTSSWTRFLQDIQQEIARLKSFNLAGARDASDEASLKRLSLTASLNLSIKPLPEEERQNFTWLGVLPEDVSITPQMAATLWDMDDERDAFDTLECFKDKALLLPGVAVNGTPTYRLHDLFHDLACNLLTAPSVPKRPGDLAGLGLNLADAHAALLEKYRQKTQNGLWHTLPNDGYIHQNLVWHLEKAKRVEKIHSLLREESQTSSNGWFEAREKLGQAGGYITDISRAWELAEANWTESTLPQVVGLECRYALISASLSSLAANVPVNLLLALVKNKKWTPQQGLAYALQNPMPQEKVNSLTELVNYLPPNLQELALQKALAAARAIQDESNRTNALSALAEKLPDILPEALAAVRAIQDDYSRVKALSALAEKLPQVWPEALAAVTAIQDESNRANALSALADKLPQVWPEALAADRAIQDDYSRVKALSALAEKLPPELLPEALAAARAIQDKSNRAKALSALADKLPPELLPEALAAAKAIQDESNRAEALSALAEKLPEVLPEALAAAKAIQDEWNRAEALSALADKLPEVLPEALAAAKAIQDEWNRAEALSALADKLPEVLPEALAAAKAIQDEWNRAEALSALADKLPEVLPEALAAAKAIQDESNRAEALSALAEKLPPELLPEALAAAKAIQDESNRAKALSALAEKLPPELLPEALAAAKAIQSEWNRAKALSALAEKLPPELLPEALAAAKAIQDESNRAKVLSALAEKLPEVLPEALAAAKAIQDESNRAKVLSALAEKLPEVLPEALAAAKAIQSEWNRAEALSALAEKLPPELLPEALAAAKAIQSEWNRAKALSALAEKLPPELLPEALAAAKAIQDEDYRAEALSALAEKLPPELLPEALAAAKAIQDESNRAKVLSALASGLSQIPSAKLFPLWQDTLHELSLRTRPNLLINIKALFPVIFALGGEVATVEIARAIVDVGRWWR
ncbi:SAM-dependent methyltransferase [Nostoc flagelliforme CCNUN1]|uniref:SAM-dependent methyltransferase n=1 Tax=Nostoc flagelliforme CCNUN1 TaxID=2038116 RepID=A0A2K8SXW2_9NOSO|nr:NB-ARC domain-containing protein [Nostoc flagelliforme]AUB40288.1 SAM-dependent methyltransferase [Nostoc flagelliforme CCNUN1]